MYTEGGKHIRGEQLHPEAGVSEPRCVVVQRIDPYMVPLAKACGLPDGVSDRRFLDCVGYGFRIGYL